MTQGAHTMNTYIREQQRQQDTLQRIHDLHRENPDALRIIIDAASAHWTACDLRNERDENHDELGAILDLIDPIG